MNRLIPILFLEDGTFGGWWYADYANASASEAAIGWTVLVAANVARQYADGIEIFKIDNGDLDTSFNGNGKVIVGGCGAGGQGEGCMDVAQNTFLTLTATRVVPFNADAAIAAYMRASAAANQPGKYGAVLGVNGQGMSRWSAGTFNGPQMNTFINDVVQRTPFSFVTLGQTSPVASPVTQIMYAYTDRLFANGFDAAQVVK